MKMVFLGVGLIMFSFVIILLKKVWVKKIEKATFELNPERLDKINEAEECGMNRLSFFLDAEVFYGQYFQINSMAPSVFIVHGNGESLSDWVDTQKLLFKLGYNSMVYDYTGFGSSQGVPSIAKLKKNTQFAWKEFSKRCDPKSKKIIVAHSLGVAVLLDAMQNNSMQADKILLHSGFSSAREISVSMGTIHKSLAWLIPNDYNNLKNILTVQNVPIRVYHSKEDKKIPFTMGEAMARKNPNAKFIALKNSEHSAIYNNPQEEFWLGLFSTNS